MSNINVKHVYVEYTNYRNGHSDRPVPAIVTVPQELFLYLLLVNGYSQHKQHIFTLTAFSVEILAMTRHFWNICILGGQFFPQDPNGFLTFTYQCVVLKNWSKGCVKYRPFCVGGSFQSRLDRGSTRRHLLWLLADFCLISAADVPERCWCYLAMRNHVDVQSMSVVWVLRSPWMDFPIQESRYTKVTRQALDNVDEGGGGCFFSPCWLMLTRDKNRICRSSGFPATNV